MRFVDRLREWRDCLRPGRKLESRVRALENKIKGVPGDTCPKCGQRSLRLEKAIPPNSADADYKELWKCTTANCEYVQERLSDPWAYIDFDVLVGSSNEYIVYLDDDGILQRETTQRLETALAKDISKMGGVFNDGAALEAHVRNEFSEELRTELLCLIGSAYVCCYDSDYEGGKRGIVSARQFLMERSEEISRSWYLSASFATAGILGLIGFGCWVFRAKIEGVVGPIVLLLLLGGAAGAIGALLSVILRSGNLNVATSAGRRLHHLEASSRIFAGALSGVIVCLAMKTGIILGNMGNPTRITIMLAALAAGASERLAPSIIAKLDSSEHPRRKSN